jgi:hypothetical protein
VESYFEFENPVAGGSEPRALHIKQGKRRLIKEKKKEN